MKEAIIFFTCCFVTTTMSSNSSSLKAPLSNLVPFTSSTTPETTAINTVVPEVTPTPEFPVDLSLDKIYLDPKVVLARRVVRDTYGWSQRQPSASFRKRVPFGIPDYYQRVSKLRNEPPKRAKPSRRRNDIRGVQRVTKRPFRLYPVFPG